jgi:VanZ family protein
MASAPLLFPHSYQAPQSRSATFFQAWFPVMLCACVFVAESTATFGTDHTSGPLRAISEAITGQSFARNWSLVHHMIRKTGHFSGYGILSLVCFRGFWLTLSNTASKLQRGLLSHWMAIYATFLVASADEIHQHHLPNRTGLFSDVILDTSGAMALQTALFLIMGAITLWTLYSKRSSAHTSADPIAESQPARQPRSIEAKIVSGTRNRIAHAGNIFMVSQVGRKTMRNLEAVMNDNLRRRQLLRLGRIVRVNAHVSRSKVSRPKHALPFSLSKFYGD